MSKLVFEANSVLAFNDNGSQFCELEVDICSTKPNSHELMFTDESLKDALATLVNKPIVAKYSELIRDVTDHAVDQVPYGGFLNKDKVWVEEIDGHLHIKGVAYLWKNYASKIINMFKRRNGKVSVSMEIDVLECEKQIITKFEFVGVTLLGESVRPSIPGSQATVLSFSEIQNIYQTENFELNRYKNIDFKIPKKVKDNAKAGLEIAVKRNIFKTPVYISMARYLSSNDNITVEKLQKIKTYFDKHSLSAPNDDNQIRDMMFGGEHSMRWSKKLLAQVSEADNKRDVFFEELANEDSLLTHPVNKSKKSIDYGDWDGEQAKRDLIKEKNFNEIAEYVCLKLEQGWENREITKLGYPVMNLKDGEWVYSAKGLSSALGYAKKENENEVISKVEEIKNDLELATTSVEPEIQDQIIEEQNAETEPNQEDKPVDEKPDVMASETDEPCEEGCEDGECEEDECEEEFVFNAEMEQMNYAKQDEYFAECLKTMAGMVKEEEFVAGLDQVKLAKLACKMSKVFAEVGKAGEVYLAKGIALTKFKNDCEENEKMAKVEAELKAVEGDLTDEQKAEFMSKAGEINLEQFSQLSNAIKAAAYEGRKSRDPKDANDFASGQATKFAIWGNTQSSHTTKKSIWE